MIKILIADDSETETALLKHIFEAEIDMCVVGCARNGREAVELAAKLKPDLITMDIQMPIMNGFEATQLIMMENPIPIVMISSYVNSKNLNTTFHALEAGAISVIEKPGNILDSRFKLICQRMINVVRGMAEISVIKRKFLRSPIIRPNKSNLNFKKHSNLSGNFYNPDYEILGIGASVGGPQVLKLIFSKMPAHYPIPIIIVQHMTAGFIAGFCQWLNEHCQQTMKCAEHEEILQPGVVYFAPENYHTNIKRIGKNLVIYLEKGEPVSGFCPSITVLLSSIAKTCGQNAVGILLTGMGSDGAAGLLELKQQHAHTLVQDAKSSVVYGMAGVAESLGAVDKIIDLNQIANYLTKLLSHN